LVGRLTVGFSGSGGAGKTPFPTQTFAGSRRIPSAAKPLSAANGVGLPFDLSATWGLRKHLDFTIDFFAQFLID